MFVIQLVKSSIVPSNLGMDSVIFYQVKLILHG